MKLIYYIERIEIIHRLISHRNTGTPSELANKIHLSTSRLSRIIEELRDMGAPIKYDRQSTTYYYEHPYEISVVLTFGAKQHVD